MRFCGGLPLQSRFGGSRKVYLDEVSFVFQSIENGLHVAKTSAVGHQELVKYALVNAQPYGSIFLPYALTLRCPWRH